MIPGVHGRLVTNAFAEDVLPTLYGAAAPSASVVRELDAWTERNEATLGPASSIRAITDVAMVPLLDLLGLAVTARHHGQDACVIATASPAGTGTGTGPIVCVVPWGTPLARVRRDATLHAIAADARWCLCCNGTALRLIDARRTWSRDYLEFDLRLLGSSGVASGAGPLRAKGGPEGPPLRTLGRTLELPPKGGREGPPLRTGRREGLPVRASGWSLHAVFWTLARAEVICGSAPLLDRVVDASRRYSVALCRDLGTGVLEALSLLLDALRLQSPAGDGRRARGAGSSSEPTLFDASLTVLYRVLFLLFAEARGLVPVWHPVYKERYSLGAIVAALLAGRRYRGIWPALQAISRLAHSGCVAGELSVTAFNGRLFSPLSLPDSDAARLGDGVMGQAVLAVSTTRVDRRGTRRAIGYRDLDVEQLGAVYEQVLDYEPVMHAGRSTLAHTRDVRKASSSFYTPRAVTAFLVRQTLAPLVHGRTADDILSLRILDPAMGSGAFLVAACRYLAGAAEDALIAEGRWHAADVTMRERVTLRREIASRCLYGVDLNPMAVQLARLSLWLATLASDRPLSFLDHRLVVGDSLVGAAPHDLARQPSRTGQRQKRHQPLPLFDGSAAAGAIEHAVLVRHSLAAERDDSLDIVRAKERALRALSSDRSPITRWRRALDLWCAGWFWTDGPAPEQGTFGDLLGAILHERAALPRKHTAPLLDQARAIASRHQFHHWPIAFPEVFADQNGQPLANGGFDAVIGNPPWDMVRGDSGDGAVRDARRDEARMFVGFLRGAGIYRVDSRAHVNRYQLFVERALQLVRRGGRLGLVLPSGVMSDTGTAPLRRHLFDRAAVDAITVLDNRHGIFPIHRSVRFALVTATPGDHTSAIACRFGVTSPDDLDRPTTPPASGDAPLVLTRRFLARVSGSDDEGVPELQTFMDLRILEHISATTPLLGAEAGWGVHFGRELNATDDRRLFMPNTHAVGTRPIVEGKHIGPFAVDLHGCTLQLRPGIDVAGRVPRRARIVYRDIASATNRLTLIATIVPARVVTTHTLFCLKTHLNVEDQYVLCALMNSFVANYLIRMRVNTHVTSALVSRLAVPRVTPDHPVHRRLAALSRSLTDLPSPGRPRSARRGAINERVESSEAYVEIQALAARLYRLTEEDFAHVLSTFPLVEADIRARALARFGERESALGLRL